MSVVVTDFQRAKKMNLRSLREITDTLLVELKVEEPELAICLVSEAEMTRLNETFLQHAGSTDVITFDYLETDGAREAKHGTLNGEIFVCVDEAILQARKFNTKWQSEIVRYVIHGVLHLTGHNDRRAVARQKMKREENRLLARMLRRFSLAQLSRPARLSA